MYALPLIGVCYPNSPVFSLHSRRRAYGDKEKPLPILWATRYPCDKATSLQADRNVATLKLGPCETRTKSGKGRWSLLRAIVTLEIHTRRRDKEGRKEATRGGRWTRAEDQDIPKLENALNCSEAED